ncbi:hypothetical protein N8830_00685, partial [Acidimicrobiaceae bacterium]|nr:hypothetical protein [Acidimicrobiaceae bacterium]
MNENQLKKQIAIYNQIQRDSFETISPISKTGAEKLWSLLNRDDQFISGLGAITAQQALQMFN